MISPVTAWIEYGLEVLDFWSWSFLQRSPEMKSPAEPESTMAVTETWKFIDFKVTGIVNGAVTEREVRTELTSIRGGLVGHERRK